MHYFRLHLNGKSMAKLYLEQYIAFFIPTMTKSNVQAILVIFFLRPKKIKLASKFLASFVKFMDKAYSAAIKNIQLLP